MKMKDVTFIEIKALVNDTDSNPCNRYIVSEMFMFDPKCSETARLKVYHKIIKKMAESLKQKIFDIK